MPYVPNATQTTEPTESQTVESAALEFRTLKASIPVQIAAGMGTEVTDRIAADVYLQTQINALATGGTGGGFTTAFAFQHINTIAVDQEILPSYNGISAGPITINAGVTVTVPSGSTWVIV